MSKKQEDAKHSASRNIASPNVQTPNLNFLPLMVPTPNAGLPAEATSNFHPESLRFSGSAFFAGTRINYGNYQLVTLIGPPISPATYHHPGAVFLRAPVPAPYSFSQAMGAPGSFIPATPSHMAPTVPQAMGAYSPVYIAPIVQGAYLGPQPYAITSPPSSCLVSSHGMSPIPNELIDRILPQPEPRLSPTSSSPVGLPPFTTQPQGNIPPQPTQKISNCELLANNTKALTGSGSTPVMGPGLGHKLLLPEDDKEELKKDPMGEETKQAECDKPQSLLTKDGRPLKRTPQAQNLICREVVAGRAYESRNVYKSIVRGIYGLVKKDKERLRTILRKEGYSDPEMEDAFDQISRYRVADKPKEIEKNAQVKIEKMLEAKTIYTYILRETLVTMIYKWEQGDLGQLSEANKEIYLEACKQFLVQVDELLRK